MKSYNFNICKYHITVAIERKPYKTAEEIKMEEKTDKFDPFYPNYLPFSEYCKAYILDHVDDYAEATLKGYKNIVENHLDSLMVCDVQDVTETVIQNAFNAEIEKGLSKKTLKGYKSFILKVIEEGYDHKFKPEIHIEKESANETA